MCPSRRGLSAPAPVHRKEARADLESRKHGCMRAKTSKLLYHHCVRRNRACLCSRLDVDRDHKAGLSYCALVDRSQSQLATLELRRDATPCAGMQVAPEGGLYAPAAPRGAMYAPRARGGGCHSSPSRTGAVQSSKYGAAPLPGATCGVRTAGVCSYSCIREAQTKRAPGTARSRVAGVGTRAAAAGVRARRGRRRSAGTPSPSWGPRSGQEVKRRRVM
jgi:hypothetical protein